MMFPSFAEFFEDVHGFEPYPWQNALAVRVAEDGWPGIVDIPTGLGKTSTIDVAVYELARQLAMGARRTAPQRIYHVVERRLVVGQVSDHMAAIVDRVNRGGSRPESPASAVRAALMRLVGPSSGPLADQAAGGVPAVVTDYVHGGHASERALLRATGCTIITMTAHQFVSRLLFRAFGSGARSRSIHAGLVGLDRLVLFDEPQLAQPAFDAVLDAERLQARAQESLGLPPGQTVILGATVPPEMDRPSHSVRHGLSDADLESPAARSRITAARPLRLEPIKSSSETATAAALADHAVRLLDAGPAPRRVWVAVNTVSMATRAAAVIGRLIGEQDVPVRVITSRVRPLDRELTEAGERSGVDDPGITVSTQCLEVGVDAVFDAVVTELCPYSSLIQRIGRLNRDGLRDDPRAVLVCPEELKPAAVRPGTRAVYGVESVLSITRALQGLAVDGVVDLSIAGQRENLTPETTQSFWPAAPRSATLHTGLVPLMTTTWPTPPGDLPVPAYVVGPDRADDAPEVMVAWRADLRVLAMCPPMAGEQVSVPLGALAALASQTPSTAPEIDDAGATIAEVPKGRPSREIRLLRDGEWREVNAWSDVRDGDLIVLPVSLGGYGASGWDPLSPSEVSDLSHVAARRVWESGGTASFALSPSIAAHLASGSDVDLVSLAEDLEARRDAETLEDLVGSASEALGVAEVRLDEDPNGVLVIVLGKEPSDPVAKGPAVVTLSDHRRQVAHWSHADAVAAGMPAQVARTLQEAGLRHDDGKAWVPYQRSFGNDGGEQVAKPLSGARTARGRRARAAGVPFGFRHEGLSALTASIAGCPPLVVHLVAAHHGLHRPFMPPREGPGQRLGVDDVEEFDRLNAQYGPWGLAYLEAVLRLADWSASRAPAKQGGGQSAVVIEPQLLESPTPAARPMRVHRMTGLKASATAAWFACVALAHAARELGDETARVWWEPTRPGGPSVTPVMGTSESIDLRDVVAHVCEHPQWDMAQRLTAAAGTSLGEKNQRVPVAVLRRLLLDAEAEDAWLVLGLFGDCAAANSQGKADMPIAPAAQNSSYVSVALSHRSEIDEICAALTSLTEGWSHDNCDGGMDRAVTGSPLIGGVGRHGDRISRGLLAPLVVYGIAALGSSGPGGYGVAQGRPTTLCLPLPTVPVTHRQLAALTLAGRSTHLAWDLIGCEWDLRLALRVEDKTTSLWLGQPMRRSRK